MKTMIAVALFFISYGTVSAQELPTKEYILSRIIAYSEKYRVSEGLLTYVVENESHYNPLVVGDTHLKCPRTGDTMRSRGLVQVSDCYHDISDSEAFDVDFSLDFLARNVAEGRSDWWTTARAYKVKYPLLFQ